MKELNRQVSLGRIKYYGVSNFGPVNMKSFVEAGGKPVTNQVNLDDRVIGDDMLYLSTM